MSQKGPTLVVPELPPFHEWEECPCGTEMEQGWGSAGPGLCCLWQSPTSQNKLLVARNLAEYWGQNREATTGKWKFSDGEQKSLCTVALSPRELRVEERRTP